MSPDRLVSPAPAMALPETRLSVGTASVARQWWLIICLTTASMLALIDKNLIQLMVTPIKHDVGLTDVQISVLIGAAFAVANMVAGLPAGWLADRYSRNRLVLAGVLIWSIATVGSGLVLSYAGLFAARAAIGLGEGVIPPACYSLLRDGVAPERRGRALALYSTATMAGAGIALLVAGALIGAIAAHGIDHIPVFGPIRPWQLALVIIGLAGLPVSLLLLSLPKVGRQHQATDATSFADAFRFMAARWPLFVPLVLYAISHAMMMATMGSWVPALIGRKFGLAPQSLGTILGLLLVIGGPGGLMLVGWGIDRLRLRGRQGAPIVAVIGAVVLACSGVVMPQIADLTSFWVVEAIVVATTTPFLVVTSVVVTQETPANMIGKVMAILLFVEALLGPALAPTIAALLSERFFAASPNALGNAISVSAAMYGAVGIVTSLAIWWVLAARRSGPALNAAAPL